MAKGDSFEREISKYLTYWLTCKHKPYAFWRQMGSGSVATVCEENKIHSGDIMAVLPEAEFMTDFWSIECKTGYPRASFWHLFKKNKGFELKEFWAKACRDALRAYKKPMLIYRKKGMSRIVGISVRDSADLHTCFPDLAAFGSLTMKFYLSELPTIVFYDLDDFFNFVKPNRMKEFIKFSRQDRDGRNYR